MVKVAYSSEYEIGGEFSRSGRLSKGGGYALRAPTIDISGDRRRRRQHRMARSRRRAASRPAKRRGPAGACMLRPRRHRAHAHRCLPHARLPRPAGLAGGAVPLDAARAEAALREKIAGPLGIDLMELCHGVYRIAISNMTRAIRSVSTERGKDPRDFDLIAFGGNGGLFAGEIARELELPRVIVPPASGIFSAFGVLHADLAHHLTQTVLGRTDRVDPAAVRSELAHAGKTSPADAPTRRLWRGALRAGAAGRAALLQPDTRARRSLARWTHHARFPGPPCGRVRRRPRAHVRPSRATAWSSSSICISWPAACRIRRGFPRRYALPRSMRWHPESAAPISEKIMAGSPHPYAREPVSTAIRGAVRLSSRNSTRQYWCRPSFRPRWIVTRTS